MINKKEEINFQLLTENFNLFVVFNSLILAIWVKISAFQIWILDISISNLKDKEKINKVIVLTYIIQLEIYFCRLASQLCDNRGG
jgi:hypothetical protein